MQLGHQPEHLELVSRLPARAEAIAHNNSPTSYDEAGARWVGPAERPAPATLPTHSNDFSQCARTRQVRYFADELSPAGKPSGATLAPCPPLPSDFPLYIIIRGIVARRFETLRFETLRMAILSGCGVPSPPGRTVGGHCCRCWHFLLPVVRTKEPLPTTARARARRQQSAARSQQAEARL